MEPNVKRCRMQRSANTNSRNKMILMMRDKILTKTKLNTVLRAKADMENINKQAKYH